jgi:hypothetical protein
MQYKTVIQNRFICIFQVPQTKKQWEGIHETFSTKWNFPGCCGAINRKHCQVKRLPNSGSEFYNYKGTYSVILFALVDGDYRFIHGCIKKFPD